MEPNPTYAVSSDPDSTYETISNIRELTPIKNMTPSPSNIKRSPHPLPMTHGYHHHDGNGQMAVPCLPPPRPNNEVGGANVYPPLPPLQFPPREDEYIEMSSQSLTSPSPRYIKGPVVSPRRGGGLEPVDEIMPIHITAGEAITNGFHFEPNNTTV